MAWWVGGGMCLSVVCGCVVVLLSGCAAYALVWCSVVWCFAVWCAVLCCAVLCCAVLCWHRCSGGAWPLAVTHGAIIAMRLVLLFLFAID